MDHLKVGLAPRKTSFYDEKTNSYITLKNPVKDIYFDENTDLSGICHACNVQPPSLVLYEGKFPKATLDAWKSKYDVAGKQAKERADKVQENSREIINTEEKGPEAASVKSMGKSLEAKAVEVKGDIEEVVEEKAETKKTVSKKRTTKAKNTEE